MSITCSDCSNEFSREELHEKLSFTPNSGKIELDCPDCGEYLTTEFYCSDCDSWFGGRSMLKSHEKKSVTEYVCPDCDGWIRKGNVLEVRQGMYR